MFDSKELIETELVDYQQNGEMYVGTVAVKTEENRPDGISPEVHDFLMSKMHDNNSFIFVSYDGKAIGGMAGINSNHSEENFLCMVGAIQKTIANISSAFERRRIEEQQAKNREDNLSER